MKSLTHDARGFVQGVVTHLRQTGKGSAMAPKVQSLLFKMTNGARKERQALVESAVTLTGEEEAMVERLLAKVSGHEVNLDCQVNPDLIGGIRIQMADWVMDVSIKSELADMASVLQAD